MIKEKLYYDFNQIELGLVGFVGYLERRLQDFIPKLPVFVLNSGDFNYFFEKKWQESENNEITQKVPRFVIKVNDIQYLQDQDTSQYVRITYVKNIDEELNVECICQGRRVAVELQLETNWVNSNFIMALSSFEMMSAIVKRPNQFTYEFMGNTYEAAFTHTSISNEIPTLDVTSGTRNVTIKTDIQLQLQLFVPRIETIEKIQDLPINTRIEGFIDEEKIFKTDIGDEEIFKDFDDYI